MAQITQSIEKPNRESRMLSVRRKELQLLVFSPGKKSQIRTNHIEDEKFKYSNNEFKEGNEHILVLGCKCSNS